MVQQNISLFQVFEFIGIILAIIFTGMGISRQIKKGYNDYVDGKMEVMDIRITSIEKEISDNEVQNKREHDRLTVLFDRIDGKLNSVLERLPHKK